MLLFANLACFFRLHDEQMLKRCTINAAPFRFKRLSICVGSERQVYSLSWADMLFPYADFAYFLPKEYLCTEKNEQQTLNAYNTVDIRMVARPLVGRS